MPSTVKYNLSYPAGTTAPNVPVAMQTSMESVEAALTGITKIRHAEYTGGSIVYPNSAATWGIGVVTADAANTFNNSFSAAGASDQINILEAGIYLIDWTINTTSLPPGGEMYIKNLGTGVVVGAGDLSRTVTWSPRLTVVGYFAAGQNVHLYTINRTASVTGSSRVKITKMQG